MIQVASEATYDILRFQFVVQSCLNLSRSEARLYCPRHREMALMSGRALPPLPGEKPSTVPVDFFLPTGIVVNMSVNTTATLAKLKEDLFREAKSYPLFKLLKDQSFYNFLGKYKGGACRLVCTCGCSL